PQWSITLQGRVAPVAGDSRRWDASLAWSFISYRPANDWLLRAGKLRMPMYLFSEIMDVGASYDVAHMPVEVYTTAPSNDYSGASLSKTWALGDAEWTLEVYGGKTKLNAAAPNGSAFRSPDLSTRTRGAVLSLHQQENVFQLGVQQAYVSFNGRTNFGGAQPGQGNGPGNGGLYGGNGAGLFNREIETRILLLGADLHLPRNLRLVGEYVKRAAVGVESPQDSQGAYLSLLNKRGAWTPYVSVARLLTDGSARTNGNGNTARFPIYSDQTSIALGTSYNLSTTSKLKAEWMHLNISGRSLLLNVPFRERSNDKSHLHIVNLSYSASF
ncbi:MAG: hypothetical protein HYZ45_07990, partial [Burkholderiales bacterium]|nr:hypothetical protein [Burkholderiales bacterium]